MGDFTTILNALDLADPGFEVAPGYTIHPANDDEVEHFRRGISPFLASVHPLGWPSRFNIYESHAVSSSDGIEGASVMEPLPRDRWRYFVIRNEFPNGGSPDELARAAALLPAEIKTGHLYIDPNLYGTLPNEPPRASALDEVLRRSSRSEGARSRGRASRSRVGLELVSLVFGDPDVERAVGGA